MKKMYLMSTGWTGMILLAVLTGGCRTAAMRTPAGFTPENGMPVEDRSAFRFNESFHFGPYEVTEVHRGWTPTQAWRLLGFGSTHARQKYEFKVKTADAVWQARCAVDVNRKELEQGLWGGTFTMDLEAMTLFACSFFRQGQEQHAWKMALSRGTGDMVLNGALINGGTPVRIEGTRQLEGSPMALTEATGYEFLRSGQTLGAVQVINNGIVWLAPSLDDHTREALAVTATALLLYDDISDR